MTNSGPSQPGTEHNWLGITASQLDSLQHILGQFDNVLGMVNNTATKFPLHSITVDSMIDRSTCVVPSSPAELNTFLSRYIPMKLQFPFSTEMYVVVPIDYLHDGNLPVTDIAVATDTWTQNLHMFRLLDDKHVVICDPPFKCKHTLRCVSPNLHWVAQKSTKHANAELRYHGYLNGGKVSVFCDQGASHSFINLGTAKRLGFKILSAPDIHASLADGRSAPIKGTVTATLKIGKYTESITLLVLNLNSTFDVILGYDWLHAHQAIINCGLHKVHITHKHRQITLDTKADISESGKVSPFLTALQLKRRMKKQPQMTMYLVAFKDTSPTLVEISDDFKDHQHQLNDTLNEFKDIFVDGLPPGPPPPRNVQHTIPLLPGSRPVSRSPYRLTPEEKLEMEKQLKELLAAGYIRESTSPFSSPVLFVPKANGKWRMCIDYRALNKLTVHNKYPLPRIDDLLDQLQSARVFTSMDLAAGYHQIRITDDDVPKTAFTTHMGLFEYTVLPFGLCNAPSTFQSVMNGVFRDFIGKFVLIYLDDILIFSKDPDEHLQHIRMVLQRLKDQQFYAQLPKCHFYQKELKFLGYIVGDGKLKADPKKTDAIVKYPPPRDVSQVRTFMGMATQFRRFVKDFAKVTTPITNVLRKVEGFHWDAEQQLAFDTIKECITTAPVLLLPDWNEPFEVIVDASKVATGAVLMQHGHPVAYESRKLQGAETRYSTREQAILALVHAIMGPISETCSIYTAI